MIWFILYCIICYSWVFIYIRFVEKVNQRDAAGFLLFWLLSPISVLIVWITQLTEFFETNPFRKLGAWMFIRKNKNA